MDAGSTLTINGTITGNYSTTAGATNRNMIMLLTGEGDGIINGAVSRSTASAGFFSLQKIGGGTWTLTNTADINGVVGG